MMLVASLKKIVWIYRITVNTLAQLLLDFKVVFVNTFELKNTKNKHLTGIILQAHSIEKGLSYKNPKVGFGRSKVISLISNIENFIKKYEANEFIIWAYNSLIEYVEFNKKRANFDKELFDRVDKLSKVPIFKRTLAGVTEINIEDIQNDSLLDFERFLRNRHSVRSFKDEIIKTELLLNAINIARFSPSACNRQCWRVHIFQGKEKCSEIVKFQGGVRGISEDLNTILFITGDMNRFSSDSHHQPYIDASLYAMTLVYTLHSQNIATLCLNASFNTKRRKELYAKFSIPFNEVPVMFIAVGYYDKSFNAPVSYRATYDMFTTIH